MSEPYPYTAAGEDLSRALREIRAAVGVSAKYFAGQLRVTPTTLRSWERGVEPSRWLWELRDPWRELRRIRGLLLGADPEPGQVDLETMRRDGRDRRRKQEIPCDA